MICVSVIIMRKRCNEFASRIAGLVWAGMLGACASAPSAHESNLAAHGTADAFEMQRCVNMGNSLENPKDAEWGGGWGGGGNIGPEDFARIKAKGFDTVRIPTRWNDYAGPGPDFKIEPAFTDHVKRIVDSALAKDLNVILNIHHFHAMMDNPEEEMDKFEALWGQIAHAFTDYSDRLWFETLNEPSAALKGALMQTSQRLAVETIRVHHPDRIIILGGEGWSNYKGLDSNIAPPDDNIVYTFHYYEPFEFTHYLAEWTKPNMPDQKRGWGSVQDRADLKAAVNHVTDYRALMGHPVFLGEFGVYTTLDDSDRVRWIEAVRTEMEAANIPWCLWAYANTFPVYDADKGVWEDDIIKALGLE